MLIFADFSKEKNNIKRNKIHKDFLAIVDTFSLFWIKRTASLLLKYLMMN